MHAAQRHALRQEHEQHGDLLQVDIAEQPGLAAHKVAVAALWMLANWADTGERTFFGKTDDHTIVHSGNLRRKVLGGDARSILGWGTEASTTR